MWPQVHDLKKHMCRLQLHILMLTNLLSKNYRYSYIKNSEGIKYVIILVPVVLNREDRWPGHRTELYVLKFYVSFLLWEENTTKQKSVKKNAFALNECKAFSEWRLSEGILLESQFSEENWIFLRLSLSQISAPIQEGWEPTRPLKGSLGPSPGPKCRKSLAKCQRAPKDPPNEGPSKNGVRASFLSFCPSPNEAAVLPSAIIAKNMCIFYSSELLSPKVTLSWWLLQSWKALPWSVWLSWMGPQWAGPLAVA